MAIIKLGAMVVGIRGTIGGVTFSANGAGPYARSYGVGANQRTERQQTYRLSIADISQAWASTSSAQKTAWATFAALAFNERFNSLGESYFPSSFNQFIRCNSNRALRGLAVNLGAPAETSIPATVISTFAIDSPLTAATKITFPAGEYNGIFFPVFIAYTRSSGPAPKPSDYRLIKTYAGSPAQTQQTLNVDIPPIFGDSIEGYTGWVKARRVLVSGVDATPVELSAVVS